MILVVSLVEPANEIPDIIFFSNQEYGDHLLHPPQVIDAFLALFLVSRVFLALILLLLNRSINFRVEEPLKLSSGLVRVAEQFSYLEKHFHDLVGPRPIPSIFVSFFPHVDVNLESLLFLTPHNFNFITKQVLLVSIGQLLVFMYPI
jgi:hypothetical protein